MRREGQYVQQFLYSNSGRCAEFEPILFILVFSIPPSLRYIIAEKSMPTLLVGELDNSQVQSGICPVARE